MSSVDLERLEALKQKAPNLSGEFHVREDIANGDFNCLADDYGRIEDEAELAYLAAIANAGPAMIAELRALRVAVEHYASLYCSRCSGDNDDESRDERCPSCGAETDS